MFPYYSLRLLSRRTDQFRPWSQNPMLWTEWVTGSIETENETSPLASQRRISVSAKSGVQGIKHKAAARIITVYLF